MKDQKRIQYCLYEIEQKLDWGKFSIWKEPEFLQLSEIISNETGINISPSTLKRLYGKVKYKEKEIYNPQRATKDALAKFLGFNDWGEYKRYYDSQTINPPHQENPALWKKKGLKAGLFIFCLAVLLLLLALWAGAFSAGKDEKQRSPLSFIVTDSIASVPYTVSIKYNIKSLSHDSIYLDFNFTHPITGPEIKKLDKQRSFYNYTYQIPGYYNISLYSNGRELANKNVLATSENWDSYFFPEAKPGLWLDNQIQISREKGYLYYPPEDLAKNGFDINSVFYVDHQLFKEFGIDGDNFEMKVRFKNSKVTGGITCFDFLTNLFCEKNLTYFTLMETGCSGYSAIKIADTEVTGVEENLSSFTFNNERWNILYVKVKDKMVKVLMNDELIYSSSYKGSNGKIVGLEHKFKGTGILDYVSLKDLGNQKEFFDDFE